MPTPCCSLIKPDHTYDSPASLLCLILFQFCDLPHSPPLLFCATYMHDHIPTKLINSAFNENRAMHCPSLLGPSSLHSLVLAESCVTTRKTQRCQHPSSKVSAGLHIHAAGKGFRVQCWLNEVFLLSYPSIY